MNLFLLTSTFEDSFEYKGEEYHVDLSFDNVLRMFESFDDPFFQGAEKIDLAFEILVPKYKEMKFESLEEWHSLYKFLLKEFLDIDVDKIDKNPKTIFDFKQDAGIIYASFFNEYGMDLFEQHGKLHWYKFLQLLTHLSDKSKFKTVVGYREMEVPSLNKCSQEERDHIIKMKKLYSLNNDGYSSESEQIAALDQKWDNLAHSLK